MTKQDSCCQCGWHRSFKLLVNRLGSTCESLECCAVSSDRYRKALQRIVDSGDNMAEGVYLGAASCYRIAKDALDNTNTFPPNEEGL